MRRSMLHLTVGDDFGQVELLSGEVASRPSGSRFQ
jgi:hypothetical protein